MLRPRRHDLSGRNGAQFVLGFLIMAAADASLVRLQATTKDELLSVSRVLSQANACRSSNATGLR